MLTRMRRGLIVEDDRDIVELVGHYLSSDGWRVDSAHDGKKALECIRTGKSLGYRLAREP